MKDQTRQSYRERILRVLVYIQTHLDEALELDTLATVAHFSPYHFHRIFRGMVGESVLQHIRRLRLERAAMRLTLSESPVTRVAFEAGYETHEAFTRAFRDHFDASPTEYRQTRRAAMLRPSPSGVHYEESGRVDEFQCAAWEVSEMTVRIQSVPETRVLFLRHVGPYMAVGDAWSRLCGWAGPRGLLGPQTVMIGVCHDAPGVTDPDKIRYDACITVGPAATPEGNIGEQTVGGGEYAVYQHVGPYETLGYSYSRLCGGWLPGSGRELRASPPLEFYRNSPMNTTPDKLITDIYLPLEPAN